MATDTWNPGQSGVADVAHVAALFADRTRSHVLLALADGRSLAASVLAAEAGVSAQAASTQLARLLDGGLVTVERSGRHRYHRTGRARDHRQLTPRTRSASPADVTVALQ